MVEHADRHRRHLRGRTHGHRRQHRHRHQLQCRHHRHTARIVAGDEETVNPSVDTNHGGGENAAAGTLAHRAMRRARCVVTRRVHDVVRAPSGGAAAAGGAAGAGRREGESCGGVAVSDQKRDGPRHRGDAVRGGDAAQAARITGMPRARALSTRLSVMPEPGKAITPFGRSFSSSSFRRNGAARPCAFQSGLHTTWCTAFRSATARRRVRRRAHRRAPAPCRRTSPSSSRAV